MKYLVPILSLVFAGLSGAAITEKYVSVAGSGTADGSSAGNSMSMATFEDYMITGGSVDATAGMRFNVLAGTYARTTNTDTWFNGGSATSPVIVRGYTTTIGDGIKTPARTSVYGDLDTGNMPLLTYTTGRINITGSFILLEALNITGASTTSSAGQVALGTSCAMRGCAVAYTGTTVSAAAVTMANSAGGAFNCDFSNSGTYTVTTGVCVSTSGTGCKVDSCHVRVTNSAAPCILVAGTGMAIYGNLCWGSGGPGITTSTTTAAPFIRNNTVVGCTGDGINIVTGTTVLEWIVGNMVTDNSGDGIDMTATTIAGFIAYNRLRDNANSFNNAGDWITATSYGQTSTDTGTTGTTATDYTNYAGNDFSLISGSPATSTNVPSSGSIGAFQRVQTTSGGQTSSASAQ